MADKSPGLRPEMTRMHRIRFHRFAAERPVGIARFVFMALADGGLRKASLALALDAIRFFFLPQFANALFRSRPVVSVDHAIDEEIPFRGELVGTYLSFIRYWMGTAFRLRQAYGRRAEAEGLVGTLARLYRDAGLVYLRCHSTTKRPKSVDDVRFGIIHVFDPHLNCVPSLHVTLVYANWAFAKDIVAAMGDSAEPSALRWLDSLHDDAVRITESILFLKQHSVNCVGASLFYLNAVFPDHFGDAACERLVLDLFTREGRDLPVRERARDRIMELYRELKTDAAARPGDRWDDTLVRYLERYGHGNGSLDAARALPERRCILSPRNRTAQEG